MYPHQAVTAVPTKITATQLKGRELDQEIAEGTETVRRPAAPEKPLFLQEKRGLSAAERGTAIHLVMQYLPLDTAPTAEAVTAQVQALAQRRLLTAAQAEAVDVKGHRGVPARPAGGAYPGRGAGVAGSTASPC